MRTWIGAATLLLLALAAASAVAQVQAVQLPGGGVTDVATQAGGVLQPVVSPGDPPAGARPGQPETNPDPGFADGARAAFHDDVVLVSLVTVTIATLGVAGFALVTRYITPKEALKNPQRSMLYGFVKGNPGVHLKKLSDEFHMKTSSILWHIRKLESAELVRSERANGFRVFYPTEGGIEVKKVGRAVTALQNANAMAIFDLVKANAGITAPSLASRAGIHVGTARWHLRKLVEFGLVEELPRGDMTLFVATPLGGRAMQSVRAAGPGAPAAALGA